MVPVDDKMAPVDDKMAPVDGKMAPVDGPRAPVDDSRVWLIGVVGSFWLDFGEIPGNFSPR